MQARIQETQAAGIAGSVKTFPPSFHPKSGFARIHHPRRKQNVLSSERYFYGQPALRLALISDT